MVFSALLGIAAMSYQPPKINEKDWTLGPVIYQVFVDRFVPPTNPAEKAKLYAAPKVFKSWDEVPVGGKKLEDVGVWSHELDFWGGDLKGIESKLDYIRGIGSDVLYLTPIHKALTNHKYDAQDYQQVSPEFGTRADLIELAKRTHSAGMKIMLDGVFNHMGHTSPWFLDAKKNPKSPYRDYFLFGSQYPKGYKTWFGTNLIVLNLENKKLRDYLWNDTTSVVRSYLHDGIDGWRLDVAFELGPKHLSELTNAAHKEVGPTKFTTVVGEIAGYPAEWVPALDGTFNSFAMQVAVKSLQGSISGNRVSRIYQQMVDDGGLAACLRSWLVFDNHDTDRATAMVPDLKQRQLVQTLQFTLPGCPVIYYGTELGMEGKGDPGSRAPMRWDLATPENPNLQWIKRLTEIRRKRPELRYGDFKALETDKLIGFVRNHGTLRQTSVVLVNPTGEKVTEIVPIRVGKLMSWGRLRDAFTGEQIAVPTALLKVEIEPYGVRIFNPYMDIENGHSPYERLENQGH